MNRRMPNGTYGGVRGERKSPLLDLFANYTNPDFLNIIGIITKEGVVVL